METQKIKISLLMLTLILGAMSIVNAKGISLSKKTTSELRTRLYVVDVVEFVSKKPINTLKRQNLFETDQLVAVIVSGTVTDLNGEPLPGVTVSVAGSTTGTVSDLDGKYSISVPEGTTLRFSFIGFETLEIQVGDQSIIMLC